MNRKVGMMGRRCCKTFDAGASTAAGVSLKFPGGEIKTLRFTPLCYNTSNLALCETPLVFGAAET
jgi:hypothetical protein